MPLYKELHQDKDTRVFVWKVEESEAALRAGLTLSPNSKNRLFTMSSEIHRRGFLSIRHLLAIAGYTDLDLTYDDLGKPHLIDDRYISITHSFEFTAIIVSARPVGIDIEKKRKKITRIARKFIGLEQQCVVNNPDPVRLLTIIWGGKESMYKLFGTKGLSFKQHCQVFPLQHQNKETTGVIRYQEEVHFFRVFFRDVEDFVLVYILPQSLD